MDDKKEKRGRSSNYRFTIKEKSSTVKLLEDSTDDKGNKRLSDYGKIDKQIRRGLTMQVSNPNFSPIKSKAPEQRKYSVAMTTRQELISYLSIPYNERKTKLSSLQKLLQPLSGIKRMFPLHSDLHKVGIEEISINAKYMPIKKHQVLNMMSERFESNYYIITGKVACIQPIQIEAHLTKKEYLDYLLNLVRYSHMDLFKACLSCNSSSFKIKETDFLNLISNYFSDDYIYINESDTKTPKVNGEASKLSFGGNLLKKKSTIISATNSLRNTRKTNNSFCGIVYDYLCNHFDEETKSLVIDPDYYLTTINKKLQELQCTEGIDHTSKISLDGLVDIKKKVTLFELKIIEILEDNDIIGRFELDCDFYKPKSTYIALLPTDAFSLKTSKYKSILGTLYEKINKDNLNIIMEAGIFRGIIKNEISKNLHQLFSTIIVRKGEIYSTTNEHHNIVDLQTELVIIKSGTFSISMTSSIMKLQKTLSKLSNNCSEFSEILQEYMNGNDGISKKDYHKPMNLTMECLGHNEVVGVDEKFKCQLQAAIAKIKIKAGYMSNKQKDEMQLDSGMLCETFVKTMEFRFMCNSANGELIIINKNALTSSLESRYTLSLILSNVLKALSDKKDYYVTRINTIINSLSTIHNSQSSTRTLISTSINTKLKPILTNSLSSRKTKSQDYNISSTLATLTDRSKDLGNLESKLRFDSLPTIIKLNEKVNRGNQQFSTLNQEKEQQTILYSSTKSPAINQSNNKASNIAELQTYLNRAKASANPKINFRSSFKDAKPKKSAMMQSDNVQRSYYFQNFTAVGNNKNNK